jgi:hypothetical protein
MVPDRGEVRPGTGTFGVLPNCLVGRPPSPSTLHPPLRTSGPEQTDVAPSIRHSSWPFSHDRNADGAASAARTPHDQDVSPRTTLGNFKRAAAVGYYFRYADERLVHEMRFNAPRGPTILWNCLENSGTRS